MADDETRNGTDLHGLAEVVPGRHGGTLRPVRTSEQGAALSRKRWERAGAAARAGLRDAAREMSEKAGLTLPDGAPLETEYDVLRALVAAHVLQAADPSARGAVQSFREVTRLAFPVPEARLDHGAVGLPAGGMQFNLSPELAREVLAALRARNGGDEAGG